MPSAAGGGGNFGGLFGTAVATMGALSCGAYVLAMDVFGPISDNAGGISEMSEQPEAVRDVTDKLDAVASLDLAGNFYFTSLRSYEDDLKSIYRRGADGNVSAVGGDITPQRKGSINMDASISPDGQTLYISRAKFGFLNPSPPSSTSSPSLIVSSASSWLCRLQRKKAQHRKPKAFIGLADRRPV